MHPDLNRPQFDEEGSRVGLPPSWPPNFVLLAPEQQYAPARRKVSHQILFENRTRLLLHGQIKLVNGNTISELSCQWIDLGLLSWHCCGSKSLASIPTLLTHEHAIPTDLRWMGPVNKAGSTLIPVRCNCTAIVLPSEPQWFLWCSLCMGVGHGLDIQLLPCLVAVTGWRTSPSPCFAFSSNSTLDGMPHAALRCVESLLVWAYNIQCCSLPEGCHVCWTGPLDTQIRHRARIYICLHNSGMPETRFKCCLLIWNTYPWLGSSSIPQIGRLPLCKLPRLFIAMTRDSWQSRPMKNALPIFSWIAAVKLYACQKAWWDYDPSEAAILLLYSVTQ